MSIYYVGHYEDATNGQKRKTYLSAINKMEYIRTACEQKGNSVQIVSCAMSKDENGIPAALVKNDAKSVMYFRTFGRKNVVTKAMDRVFMPVQLLLYLLRNVKKQDRLIIYHAVSCMGIIKFVKRIKKCQLILEFEELYSDVNGDKNLRRRELAMAANADAFVFPTQQLNKVVNCTNKPFVVVHGTYQVEKERTQRFNDGRIHVVYAGTLDPRKGGAVAAVAATEYLPKNYHVHILGFGSNEQIQKMNELVSIMVAKSAAQITYEGVLSGEEYIRFIQSCDIGLSTQNPDAAFNDTSFPSKVLSYMANGLRVVSVRIKAVETSAVGDMITYYDEQTPEGIAKAIMSVNMAQPYDSRKRIAELDEQFQKELKQLIEAK